MLKKALIFLALTIALITAVSVVTFAEFIPITCM